MDGNIVCIIGIISLMNQNLVMLFNQVLKRKGNIKLQVCLEIKCLAIHYFLWNIY